MSRPSVYIETTIVSYLTARPSPSLVAAAYQQITTDWWGHDGRWIPLKKSFFDLFTLVFDPANEGGLAVFGGFSAESR
jgi:hypothetical protein